MKKTTALSIQLRDTKWKIRRKRWLWNLMPFAGRNKFTTTWGETTYLTPKNYQVWLWGVQHEWLDDLLRHEYTHVQAWRRDPHYNRSYLLSRTYRRIVEVSAYAEQCRYSPLPRRAERAAKYAKWLSSWRYGWLGKQDEIAQDILQVSGAQNAVEEEVP